MNHLEKKLVPSTIIPAAMYVERTADKQLQSVIRDMGRPAYILVARQMGKTNLLINAIRNLKGTNDIFGYIDLSNRFDTDRECFRNIIDKILDSNSEKLKTIAESIYLKREGEQIVAHREHQRELRQILSGITGKLIVNLDEIDSLTAADYSDKIFAQIRSVYFDRINFQDFERLSYIISGVAEPSDIIKDKSISPFNIGQKILLGDFTYEEFLTLVSKAGLDSNIKDNIKERIFHWTNGNPRLSWEVLSEVEDKVISGEVIDDIAIDNIVKHMYMTNFDKPPIDHIRSLIISNIELREAVISIYYGKTDSISNDIKNRLYLAGVLGSDYEFGDIRIKNRIVEASLDLAWLIELNKNKKISIDKAREHFDKAEYSKAIEIFENIIENNDFSESERLNSNYKLGACYFNLGDDLKTISCYENKLFDKNGYYDMYSEQIYILAIANSRLKNNYESQKYFDELIENEYGEFFHLALVGKAKLLESIDKIGNREEIIRLNRIVIEANKIPSKEALSGAYFNLATLYSINNIDESYIYYLKASEFAALSHQIKPLIHALRLKTGDYESLFNRIINTLCSGEIKFDNDKEPYGLEVNISELTDLIIISRTLDKYDEIEIFINTIKENCFYEKANVCSVMFQMAALKVQGSQPKEAKYILNKIILLEREFTSPMPMFLAYKFLSFIDSENEAVFEHYFSRVQNYTEAIDATDVSIFEKRIIALINNGQIEKAEKYCDMLINIEGLASHKSRVRLLTILFLKMRCIKDIDEKRAQALDLNEIIKNIEQDDLHLTTINDATLKSLSKEVNAAIVAVIPVRQFIREGVRYGRNDIVKVIYQDGREEHKKYKHILDSLNRGLCEIVS